jgi:hypothetical protein
MALIPLQHKYEALRKIRSTAVLSIETINIRWNRELLRYGLQRN